MGFQTTIREQLTFAGVGLHSGVETSVVLRPAPAHSGKMIRRVDLPGKPDFPALVSSVIGTKLATTLGNGVASVATVEHLLSALAGMGVDNVEIEVAGPEIPILDGSALPFAAGIAQVGIEVQGYLRSLLVVTHKISVVDGNRRAALLPLRGLRMDCTVDFPHPLVTDVHCVFDAATESYLTEVAPARTFAFLKEIDELRALGLARGGSLDNAVVLDATSVLNPEGLRFPDEFARHKILDAIGDLSLIGFPLVAEFVGVRNGHSLHYQLVNKLLAEPGNFTVVTASISAMESPETLFPGTRMHGAA